VIDRLLAKKPDDRAASAWSVCVTLEQAGATYPFRRALRPGHLIADGMPYDEAVTRALRLDDINRADLDELTDGQVTALRVVLGANFRQGSLSYKDGRFELTGRWYRPAMCRRRVLKRYSLMPLVGKRRAANAAVAGGYPALDAITRPGIEPPVPKPASLPRLLLPLMHVATVKRTAARLANAAERAELHASAAELFVMAGQLQPAERCADLAARELRSKGRNRAALSLLRKVIWFASDAGKEFECRRAFVLKGAIHLENGEIEAAKADYRRVIETYRGRPEDLTLAEAYNGLGDAFRVRHDCKSSIEALTQALDVASRIGNEIQMSHTLVNIGIVHWLENDLRQALAKFRAAYQIQKRTDIVADQASTLHNIATIFLMDGRLRRGLFLMGHALKLKREVGNLGEIARSLNNLGYAHQMLGEPAKAVDYLAESLEINRKIGSKKEVLYNIENLIRLRISAGQLRESLTLVREGISLATEQDHRVHLASLQVFGASVAKRMGRPGEAARTLASAGATIQQLDDNQVIMLHAVQTASLRFYIGDREAALELATKAYENATHAHNTAGQLDSLLLLNRLVENEEYFTAAVKAIEELHLTRERHILKFGRLEYALEHNVAVERDQLPDEFVGETLKNDDDLETAWMNNIAAEIMLNIGDVAASSTMIERSVRFARHCGLVPELITAQALMARIAEINRDYESCYKLYKDALGLCRMVSDDIENKADREIYQKSRWVLFVAHGIKKLGTRLAQKQQAGR